MRNQYELFLWSNKREHETYKYSIKADFPPGLNCLLNRKCSERGRFESNTQLICYIGKADEDRQSFGSGKG